MEIQSLPGDATVYIINAENPQAEKIKLGKTPLKIEQAFIPEGKTFLLQLEKKGFGTREILVPSPQEIGRDFEFIINFSHPARQNSKINEKFLVIKNYINQKQYDQAEIEIESLIQQQSQFAQLYALQGTIYYLQKRYKLAKQAWDKSLVFDPANHKIKKLSLTLDRLNE